MSPQELAFRRGKCFIKSATLSGGLELLHCPHRKRCYYFQKSPLVSRGCLEDHFLSRSWCEEGEDSLTALRILDLLP